MRRYSDQPRNASALNVGRTPDAAVRAAIAAGELSRVVVEDRAPTTWDALLYAEDRQDHELVVCQVANVLLVL